MCLTELIVETEKLTCTCNMIDASLIRVFNDGSQPIGNVVQFPSVIMSQRKLDVQIKGFSYFFIALIASSSLFGLVGSALLWLKDKNDWKAQRDRRLNLTE